MGILIVVTDREVEPLRQKIKRELPAETAVWVYPEMPDPALVEMVVLWKHPPGLLQRLPALRLISSLGAGVEHIINDPDLPAGIRITRIVDEALTSSMRNYVLLCVLHYHKRFLQLRQQQEHRQWVKPDPAERPLKVGILGLGALGTSIARTLADLGFPVYGYRRQGPPLEGIRCFSASKTPLVEFARQVNVLVCLLPSTPATEGILDYGLFSALPRGSALVNVARGSHLVEEDLLPALHDGFLSEVYLDVFREEPLPAGHPFWQDPRIVITPHIASITDQDNAARIIADNYQRLKKGAPLRFEVDRVSGY